MSEEKINKYNALLQGSTDEFDVIGGYEVLLGGLEKNLSDLYGLNTAKNFIYQLGTGPGKQVATILLQEHNNEIYTDPLEATGELLIRLKSYHSAQIQKAYVEGGKTHIVLYNTCFLNGMFKRRPDMVRGDILCRLNKGYFEFALKNLTKKNVILNFIESANERCTLELIFS